jgi:two-component system CheB/CheR fusion protein
MGRNTHRHRSDGHRRRVSVLVVEDDSDSREILRRLVAWLGATVHVAENGRKALKFLARQTPDLIFLDLRMPGVDGFAVMKQVKANPRLDRVRTVAVTASCTEADYLRTRTAGFDVHLAKPVDIDTVARIVEEVIGGHGPHRHAS